MENQNQTDNTANLHPDELEGISIETTPKGVKYLILDLEKLQVVERNIKMIKFVFIKK